MERIASAAGLLRESKLAALGALIFLSILAVAVVAPFAIPASVVRDVRFGDRLAPPDAAHWFGTDDFGRDLFRLVLLAASLDLRAALAVVGSALVIGCALGATATGTPPITTGLAGSDTSTIVTLNGYSSKPKTGSWET